MYNAILGRLVLNRLRAVTSTYHLLMCFPTEGGVGEVKGDQITFRECYMASLKGEPTPKENMSIYSLEVRDKRAQVIAEPEGELEDVTLDPNTTDKVTRGGADLPEEFKARL